MAMAQLSTAMAKISCAKRRYGKARHSKAMALIRVLLLGNSMAKQPEAAAKNSLALLWHCGVVYGMASAWQGIAQANQSNR